MTRDQDTERATARRLLSGALAGLLTAAVALGVAELAAALISASSAPVIAVGETAINLTPIPVKEFAITHFGSHDKEGLLTGIVVLLAAFAALIGVAAVRRIGYGLAGLAVFAGIGMAAAVRLPTGTAVDVIPTLAGVAAAAATMVVLVRALRAACQAAPAIPPAAAAAAAPGAALAKSPQAGAPEAARRASSAEEVPAAGPYLADLEPPVGREHPVDPRDSRSAAPSPDRRRFLIAGAGAAALAAVAGGAGDKLLSRFSIASSRAQVRLPAAAVRAPAVPVGTAFAGLREPDTEPDAASPREQYRHLMLEVLAAERAELLAVRSVGNYTSRTLTRAQRALDLLEATLQQIPDLEVQDSS